MAPSIAKAHYLKNEIAVTVGGACDSIKISGLMAFKPWIAESESAQYTKHPEATWLRVHCTKQIIPTIGMSQSAFIREIPSEEGKRRQWEFVDFYLPFWYALKFAPTLENQDPNYRAALEIRVPQLLPEAVPAK